MATMNTKIGVPGVSTSALEAIQDDNTRTVLQQIVDGWNVRNGASGSGDCRFITKGEMFGEVGQIIASAIPPGWGVNPSGGVSGVLGYVSGLLDAIQDEIRNLELWRKLGERISLIEIPNIFKRIDYVEIALDHEVTQRKTDTSASLQVIDRMGVRVGNNESGLTQEKLFRANSDSALAQAINTIWAVVGSNSGLVQDGQTVTVNEYGVIAERWNQVQAALKDPVTGQYVSTTAVREESKAEIDRVKGRMTAEHTVKVDINGYVSGYGLMATQDMATGATTSAFGVRADTFFVGNVTQAGRQDIAPFVVKSYAQTINGVLRPPGVYITDAVIGNGAIGTAQIGIAAVDVLQIAGGSVTTNRTSGLIQSSTAVSPGAYSPTLAAVSISLAASNSGAMVSATLNLMGNGGDSTVVIELLRNGNVFSWRAVSVINGYQFTFTIQDFDDLYGQQGTYSYALRCYNPTVGPGSNVGFQALYPVITVAGAQR